VNGFGAIGSITILSKYYTILTVMEFITKI